MLEPVKIRQFDFCCLMQFCVCSGLEAALAQAVQVVLAVPAALPVLPWIAGACVAMAGSSVLVTRLEHRCTRTAFDRLTCLSSLLFPAGKHNFCQELKMEHRGKLSCSKGLGSAESAKLGLKQLAQVAEA